MLRVWRHPHEGGLAFVVRREEAETRKPAVGSFWNVLRCLSLFKSGTILFLHDDWIEVDTFRCFCRGGAVVGSTHCIKHMSAKLF